MPRPPLAQPLFFFSVLLVLGGAAGAVGSFWWTARWHERDTQTVAGPAGSPAMESADAGEEALPLVEKSEWENRPGWRWLIEPMRAGSGTSGGTAAGVFAVLESRDGLNVMLSRAETRNRDPLGPRFSAVAFDGDGNRLAAVDQMGGASSGGVAFRRFLFRPADAAVDDIGRIGIEVLTPDAWREAARDLYEEAKAEGIRTLPFPEVGKPYPFELDLPGGKVLGSADYEGRVVFFDCWASWCAPCMAKMPDLRAAYDRYHDRGLDIIGINFDFDADLASKAIAEHAPDWPHVLAGTNGEGSRYWADVTTVAGLPRFFLVDRDGVLRWDSQNTAPDALTRAIEECLAG